MNAQGGKVLGAVKEAGLLIALVLAIPVVMIVIGAPIALLVRLVIELTN